MLEFPFWSIVLGLERGSVHGKRRQTEPEEPLKLKKPLLQQNVGDIVTDLVTDSILGMPSIPKEQRLANLSDEQKQQLQQVIDQTITAAHGQLDELQSALGMLLIGHHFGWKVTDRLHG